MAAADLIPYNTGATAEGSPNADEGRSLGGYRAGSCLESLGHTLDAPIRGIVILHVAGLNGAGNGLLTAVSNNSISWAAPGESPGTAVTINNGETKVIKSGTGQKYIQVSRTTADNLAGECTVTLSEIFHNVVAFEPATAGGSTDFRVFIIKNIGAANMAGIKIWIDPAAVTLSMALDVVDGSGYVRDQSIPGENNDPGFSFTTPTTEGGALAFDLSAGSSRAVWLKRVIPGTGSSIGTLQKIHVKEPLDSESLEIFGRYTLQDPALDRFESYKGSDAPIDYSTPWETFSSLPHTSAALAVSQTHKVVVRKRNAWNYLSQNIREYEITLDGSGNLVSVAPTAPLETSVEALPGLSIRAISRYDYDADGTNQADQWLVYSKIGSAPVPGVDTPAVVTMSKADGIAPLAHVLTGYAAGDVVQVIVQVRRSSDTKDSTNNTPYSATAVETISEPSPGCSGVSRISEPDNLVIWTHDSNNYLEVDRAREVLRIVLDGAAVAGMGRGRTFTAAGGFREWNLSSNSTQSADIEYVTGTPNKIKIGVGNGTKTTVAEIDANGLVKIGTAQEQATWPKWGWAGGANYTDYNSTPDALEFSLDLIRTAFDFQKYDQGGGIWNSRLRANRFREGQL